MEIEIINQRENKLLDRLEVEFKVKHPNSPTPPRQQIREKLMGLLTKDLDKIFIIRLKSRAGTNTSYGLAHIYETQERALQIEPKYIIERNEGKKQEEKEAE